MTEPSFRHPQLPDLSPPEDPQDLGDEAYGKSFWQNLPRALTMPLDPTRLAVLLVVSMIVVPIWDLLQIWAGRVDGSLFVHTPFIMLIVAFMTHAQVSAAQGRRSLFPHRVNYDILSFVFFPLWRVLPGALLALFPLAVLHSEAAAMPFQALAGLWALVILPLTLMLASLGFSPLSIFRSEMLGRLRQTDLTQLAVAMGLFMAFMALGALLAPITLKAVGSTYGYGAAFAATMTCGLIATQPLGLFAWCHLDTLLDATHPTEPQPEAQPRQAVVFDPTPPKAQGPTPKAPQEDPEARIKSALAAEAQAILGRDRD